MKKLSFISFLFLFAIVSCNNPTSEESIVASENWKIQEPGTQNHAALKLSKTKNGIITCTGSWYFNFFGDTVTCTLMRATVIKSDTVYLFTCTGKAEYPPEEDGYIEASQFTLLFDADLDDETGRGTWEISFTDKEWNDWAPEPGELVATLESGSGVTR